MAGEADAKAGMEAGKGEEAGCKEQVGSDLDLIEVKKAIEAEALLPEGTGHREVLLREMIQKIKKAANDEESKEFESLMREVSKDGRNSMKKESFKASHREAFRHGRASVHLQMRIESLEKEIRDLQRSIKWRRDKTAAFGHDALRKAEQQYAKVVEILRRRLENIRKRAAEARDFSDQLKNKINECRKTRKIYLGEIEDTRAALERLRYEKRTWEDFEEEKRLALAVLKRQSLILEEAAKAKRAKYQQRYLATVNAIEKLDGADSRKLPPTFSSPQRKR